MRSVRSPIAALLLSVLLASGASPDALVDRLRAQLSQVKDYTCDVTLNALLPSFTVRDMRMRVYYKRPNRVRVEAKEGFAMLPEEGLYMGDPVEEALRTYNLVRLGDAKWQGRAAVKYALRPKADSAAPLASARIYLDKARALPLGFTGTSRSFGEVTTEFTYSRINNKYWLPTKTVFRMKNPPRVGGERDKSPRSGSATLTMTNYRVNTGLPDSIFKRPANSAKREKGK